MKTIDNLNFKNKRELICVDFNVSLNDVFEVTELLQDHPGIYQKNFP